MPLVPLRSIGFLVRNDKGVVAPILALALVPLIVAVGSAIDYSGATNLRSHLQTASDATTLALCKADPNLTATDLHAKASATIQSYLPGKNATVDPPVVTSAPRSVQLTTHVTYRPVFANFVGVPAINMTVQSGCSAAERFFEIALVLDTTGSMSRSDGTTTKIAALRTAASDFVNHIYTTAKLSQYAKISLVPFSAAVAVDPAAYRTAGWVDTAGRSSLHWSQWQNATDGPANGFASRLAIFDRLKLSYAGWDWAGCFESLPYPLNVQDAKPDGSADSYYVPMLAPDEPNEPNVDPSNRVYYNSYIRDATLDQNCTTTPPDDRTKTARACKYKNPRGATTSGGVGPNWMCRSRPLTRLTNDQNKLLSEIQALSANGNTNIHEGFMWGWRTVSPNSVFGEGVPYTQQNTTKVIVLMTDGVNTWTSWSASAMRSFYSAYGYFTNPDGSKPNVHLQPANANPASETDARDAMDALTREACSNARTAGVLIYTIGFSISTDPIDQKGIDMLRDCAGDPARAFVANDANSLIKVFKSIAQGIGELRISR